MRYVVVPGIDGSDEVHWQSIWQAEWDAAATRIAPASWTEPDLEDWVRAVDRAAGDDDVVIVAHSLGCWAAVEWLARQGSRRCGLFLVAPPNTWGPHFPAAAADFTVLRPSAVKVPGLVVGSDDDPYCEPATVERLAAAWDLPHLSAGPIGHINSASRLGRWDFGRDLLTAFTAGSHQDVEMLGRRLPRHIELLAQLAQRLPIAFAQPIQQLPPRRVGERLEYGIHGLRAHDLHNAGSYLHKSTAITAG